MRYCESSGIRLGLVGIKYFARLRKLIIPFSLAGNIQNVEGMRFGLESTKVVMKSPCEVEIGSKKGLLSPKLCHVDLLIPMFAML